jgi:large subunit ribosomal protein L24
MSIHISNVAIYNFSLKKADRVGFRLDSNDKKVRIFRTTNELIEV